MKVRDIQQTPFTGLLQKQRLETKHTKSSPRNLENEEKSLVNLSLNGSPRRCPRKEKGPHLSPGSFLTYTAKAILGYVKRGKAEKASNRAGYTFKGVLRLEREMCF